MIPTLGPFWPCPGRSSRRGHRTTDALETANATADRERLRLEMELDEARGRIAGLRAAIDRLHALVGSRREPDGADADR